MSHGRQPTEIRGMEFSEAPTEVVEEEEGVQ